MACILPSAAMVSFSFILDLLRSKSAVYPVDGGIHGL